MSPSENDDHMVAENDTFSFSHFFYFSLGPDAALNSHVKKYLLLCRLTLRMFLSKEELFLNSGQ